MSRESASNSGEEFSQEQHEEVKLVKDQSPTRESSRRHPVIAEGKESHQGQNEERKVAIEHGRYQTGGKVATMQPHGRYQTGENPGCAEKKKKRAGFFSCCGLRPPRSPQQ